MSEREWKPGDVAVLENHGGTIAVRAPKDCRVVGHASAASDHWHYLTNVGGATWDSNSERPARPLVVIDPEDREQVTRLRDALWREADTHDPGGLAVQAALRSLIEPPKPPEPQGLGAVVEDASGDVYVKWSTHHREDRNWKRHDISGGSYDSWSNIAAVRVLAEGWSE